MEKSKRKTNNSSLRRTPQLSAREGPSSGGSSTRSDPPISFSDEGISFSDKDLEGVIMPHEEDPVVSMDIANCEVHRILMASGSLVNILYYDAFKKMGISEDRLKKPSTPPCIFGFDGPHETEGMIELPVTAGTAPKQITVMVNFLVVKIPSPSPYNVIIGTPGLDALSAIVSINHLKVKFPTPHGIGEMRMRSNLPISFPDEDMSFSDKDLEGVIIPHEDDPVVSMNIANCEVHRILMATGSSVDILYYDAFKKMGINKNRLKKPATPSCIFGFDGPLEAEGMIELPVTAGTAPKKTTVMVNFLVVKIPSPSPYNVIIGAPGLDALSAVVSTYHLKVKFPTPHGIGEMRMRSNPFKKLLRFVL